MLEKKCKKCRRYGEKLFLKGDRCSTPKCALTRRNYAPGIHGPKGEPRLSEYGTQLYGKQKAKKIYGTREKQFKNYFTKANKQEGVTGEKLAQLLESRLDNVIFRLGFAKSRTLARQLVNHGHIQVNDRSVNIPSYQIKLNEVIKVKDGSKKNKYFQIIPKTIVKDEVPKWLEIDTTNLLGKVVGLPTQADMDRSINLKQIIEFYSK